MSQNSVFEPESPLSIKLMAAHLFYRALLNVRSLITDWWRQCKDRQLSMAVANTTARYFSPILIAAEFAHLKDPEVISELNDESWDLKVANAINEVSMMFNVDEQQLEIRIKIPIDYPLHNVEIRDINRVGMEEQRWRGWILAVQQVLTGQVCSHALYLSIRYLYFAERSHRGWLIHLQKERDNLLQRSS